MKKIEPIRIKRKLGRIPIAPPSQEFKDRSKYNRKKKHKKRIEE